MNSILFYLITDIKKWTISKAITQLTGLVLEYIYQRNSSKKLGLRDGIMVLNDSIGDSVDHQRWIDARTLNYTP